MTTAIASPMTDIGNALSNRRSPIAGQAATITGARWKVDVGCQAATTAQNAANTSEPRILRLFCMPLTTARPTRRGERVSQGRLSALNGACQLVVLDEMSTQGTRTDSTRLHKLLTAVAVAGVLLGAIFWLTSAGDSDDATSQAAPNVTLEFFDGTSRELSEFRGKPVVLNFWASWCPACISEMPAFGEVHRRLGDQVVFVGVNMQEVDLEAAVDLAEQTNVDYQLAHDPDGAIYSQFGGIAMPTTVFIAADGSVELVHAGAIFAEDLTQTIESELLG
jgi:cytochrome c biogenesis protein CcmG/thiol:disulfide interchange protein DsbE